jgi:hypothetical protein
MDASISPAARTIRFGEVFAASGMTTVALDEYSRLMRHHPDGTTSRLEWRTPCVSALWQMWVVICDAVDRCPVPRTG